MHHHFNKLSALASLSSTQDRRHPARRAPRKLPAASSAHLPSPRCEPLEARLLLAASIHINFQPSKAPGSVGYIKDVGDVFGKHRRLNFGWNADNSASATSRDSLDAPDARYDTANLLTAGRKGKYWEIALPNGLYSVRIVGGDPTQLGQRVKIEAESTLVVNSVTRAKRPWAEGAQNVRVTDGRLTLRTAEDAPISPIAFVDITPLIDSAEPIAAPRFDSMSGVFATRRTISSLDHGDWLRFDNVFFGAGVRSVQVDMASPFQSTQAPQKAARRSFAPAIEFRLNRPNGPVIGRLFVQPTGTGEVFYSEHTSIRRARGTQSLYLVFKGDGPIGTIRSIQFSPEPLTTIMPLGDSITEGEGSDATYRYWLWQSLVNAGQRVDFVGSRTGIRPGTGALPYWDFDQNHQGEWGLTTADVLSRVDQYAAYKPDVVLIHLGTNDLMNDRPIDEIIANLSTIIGRFRFHNPSTTILLAQIIPTTHLPSVLIDALNARIAALAIEKTTPQSPVTAVDQRAGFDAVADSYDGIHPYEWGEQKIASKFFNALKNVLDMT